MVQLKLFFSVSKMTQTGFEVVLPPAHPDKIIPVLVLKNYIDRTSDMRPADRRLVFLTLRPPYRPIKADTVAQILNGVIARAGLGVCNYSAKDFRPTGATVAIDNNTDPEVVMRIERWKTR